MTLAAFVILMVSSLRIVALYRKYQRDGDTDTTVEEFFTRASLEDIIKARHYATDGMMAFCLMTIGSIVKL